MLQEMSSQHGNVILNMEGTVRSPFSNAVDTAEIAIEICIRLVTTKLLGKFDGECFYCSF